MTKMGQIVKKKKKGRPSKSDLARRSNQAAPPGRELRRSHRQRSVRYTFDFDDYLDDDELFENLEDDDDDEDDRRREKKQLKHLLQKSREAESKSRRVSHAPSVSQSSSSDTESDDRRKPSKKQKITRSRSRSRGRDDEEEDEDEMDDEDDNAGVDKVVRTVKIEPKGVAVEEDSAPGTPPPGIPLPDKKTLEVILDKLQKKDYYGVYAQPVDPEELPDYHEVIEHPMDFSTVRKKLGKGSYVTLEQFENDVYLISSNSMEYNAPDTIYYRQARSIQELAKKKFETLREELERSEEPKSEQKPRVSSIVKKQVMKPVSRTIHDSLGSDFSSGATLATIGDLLNASSAPQTGGSERASSIERPVKGTYLVDNNIEKPEETTPGKRTLPRPEKKSLLNDDNRRATFNISTEAVYSSDSVLATFDEESKQLVSVGLHADHSYARSLARFASTLGPVAWRIASKRIEQALPSEFKYGRGWVGEYEPLPTSVLILENCAVKEPPFFRKIERAIDTRKKQKMPPKSATSRQNMVIEPRADRSRKSAPFNRGSLVVEPTLDRKSAFFGPAVIKPTASPLPSKELAHRVTGSEGKSSPFCAPGNKTASPLPSKELAHRVTGSEGKSSPFCAPGNKTASPLPSKELAHRVTGSEGKSSPFCAPGNKTAFAAPPILQPHNAKPRNFMEPQRKTVMQVELNRPPLGSQAPEFSLERQGLNSAERPSLRPMEINRENNKLLQNASFKQPNNLNGGFPNGLPNENGSKNGGLPSGLSSSSSDVAKQMGYFPRVQDQGLTDPVQLMRMMAEKSQNHQNPSTHYSREASPVPAPAPAPRPSSPRKEDSRNAAAAAARAWMSIGAGGNTNQHKNHISADSLYNSARDPQPHVAPSYAMQFQQLQQQQQQQQQQVKNGFAFHPFVQQPTRMGNEAQFQGRPMVFPQLVNSTDLSRFQMQSPWQSLGPQMQQPRQRQESMPPDLNISFQSSGSPGRPTSGVLVDSQQPDLALQL